VKARIDELLRGLAESTEPIYPGEFSGSEPDPRHQPLEDELAALGPAALEPLAAAARVLPRDGERVQALRALRGLRPALLAAGQARVDEVHHQALADPAPSVRVDALEVVRLEPWGRAGPLGEDDLARLDALRRDRSSLVRAAVAYRLARVPNPRALEWLEAMAADEASQVRQVVYPALAARGRERFRELLIPQLAAADPGARFDATVALEGGGPWPPEAVPVLVGLAADTDPRVRRFAAAELAESGDPRAIEPVLRLCADPDDWVLGIHPMRVTRLLHRLGAPGRANVDAALAALGPLLVGPRQDLEVWAAEAHHQILHAHGPPEATEPRDRLVLALTRSLVQAGHRAIAPAARAAGELADRRLIPPLLRTLERPLRGDDTDGAVGEALARMGAPAVAALHALFGARKQPPDVRVRAARMLGRLGDATAVELLCGGLRDRDLAVREEAATAIGVLANPRAVGPLLRALADVPPVAAAAARALGQIGDARARPHLAGAAAHADPRVRKLAAEALTRLG